MKYDLLKELINLIEDFEAENASKPSYCADIKNFKRWISLNNNDQDQANEPIWEGKKNGRSADSAISTLFVHMNRYAKSYSKSAIFDSSFTSQEDFIYLINLKAFGEMSKMELIKKNVHEKTTGMKIIDRLISQGWVNQADSISDKRSKVIKINSKGLEVLEGQMGKIRKATEIVSGDLTYNEKLQLIALLNKLNNFHQPIYDKHFETENLLEEAFKYKSR